MMTVQPGQKAEDLQSVVGKIKNEGLDAVIAREATTFDRLATPFSDRIVLFGAGPLGRGVLTSLREAGVEPCAFGDNNPQLWGKYVQGLLVLSPDETVKRYRDSACFVVTIYNGSAVRKQLSGMGCEHVVPFPALFWKYAQIFTPDRGIDLPHRLRQEIDEIQKCYQVLHDEASRRELTEQLAWRYWLDYEVLSPALPPQHTYFPFDLLSPINDEVFVDCGSFDGDTIRSFVTHWSGGFKHAYAFEPDPVNREALAKSIASLGLNGHVSIMPCAVGDRNGPVSFNSTSSAGSHLTGTETGVTVECRKLDDITWALLPTYIKMDIESAEPQALSGGREFLSRNLPILAVCTYHRSSHLWRIPNLIHSIAPEYRIFLRRYAEECWEGVCYAIPPHRLKSV